MVIKLNWKIYKLEIHLNLKSSNFIKSVKLKSKSINSINSFSNTELYEYQDPIQQSFNLQMRSDFLIHETNPEIEKMLFNIQNTVSEYL